MKKLLYFTFFITNFFINSFPSQAEEIIKKTPMYHKIPVAFTSQIPEGNWKAPWNNACEEASIIMVEEFYLGRTKSFTTKEAKDAILTLTAWEDKTFGSNKDTDSKRTARVINDYSSFKAQTVENPTVEQIKEQLLLNHPVISLHYGFDLKNPNLHFRASGSSYHMMVIKGFDESKQEFIVNDPGFSGGLDYRYSYAIFMNTLHDFNHETLKTDGTPVVLFTEPKILAKTKDHPGVYLIEENTKYPIAHSGVLKNHRWSWKLVKRVEKNWLEQYQTGALITE